MRTLLPVVLLLVVSVASAQSPLPPRIGETIDVSIINVDVVVTDRDGKRVRGLTKDDFVILENGEPRAISNFAEYAAGAGEGVAGVDGPESVESAPRQPRTIVLFVEQMRLLDFEAEPFVASIRALLTRTVQPGDAVAIVTWAPRGDLRLAFTDDQQAIERALAGVATAAVRTFHDPLPGHRRDLTETIQFEEEVRAFAGSRGSGQFRSPTVPDRKTAGDASAAILAQIAMLEMNDRVAAINATIHSMAGREGKKILLLATRRLGEVAGAEFFYAAGADVLDSNAKVRFGTTELIRSIVDNANAAGVTIYPTYPPGLKSSMPDASTTLAPDGRLEGLIVMNETASMTYIAEKTGGMLARNVAEVVRLMPRVEEDLNEYYSLAYRVSSSGTDRTRDIVVRTKDPGWKVRARRQHVEKSDSTRMKDRVIAALYRDDSDAEFAIGAKLAPPKMQGRREVVPLEVRIPIKSLTVLPSGGRHAGAFSVFIASSANVGRASEVTHRTQSFEIAGRDLDRARTSHFTYAFDVVVDRAADRVAVIVFDEIAKTYGLVRLPIPERAAGTNPVPEGRNGTR